jgi:hypothetical protein
MSSPANSPAAGSAAAADEVVRAAVRPVLATDDVEGDDPWAGIPEAVLGMGAAYDTDTTGGCG